MKQFLSRMWQWMGRANSDGDLNPSAERAQSTYMVIIFGLVIAFGFLYVLRFYPQFTMEYLIILSARLVIGQSISTKKKSIEVDGEVKRAEINKTIDPGKMTGDQTKSVEIAKANQ